MDRHLFEMTLEQFTRQAIAVTVTPVMADGGNIKLVPSDAEAEAALGEFKNEFVRAGHAALIPDGNIAVWAAAQVEAVLSLNFSDEIWYGRMPGSIGRPVILIKDQPARLHGLNAILRRTHLNEVLDAMRSGMEIPQPVAQEYAEELSDFVKQRNLPIS